MKLTWRIVIRISLLMSLVLAVWAVLFHNAVIEEVNDETDDALELFSENLIQRILRGEQMPDANNGTNNTYFLSGIDAEYAQTHPNVVFSNEVVYIKEKEELEPARVLKTIFRDAQGGYHLLTVATPSLETDDLREALTGWIVTLYVVLLLLTVAVCVWVLWRSMRPLYRLLRWLDASDVSQGVKPLNNPTQVDEFVRLNDAVVRSARRSEASYNQQKQFTGNASHEIQTPLAVCKGRLDLLLDTSLSEEQMGEVIKVQQTLDHISRMNKELLLLAKIDGGQFVETTTVDFGTLLVKSAEECAIIYHNEARAVSIDAVAGAEVKMNSTLAQIMVSNLVKNAFLHNSVAGDICLHVADGTLRVSNAGESPLDEKQLFERFYQGTKREGSTGLGLAIVQAIATLYGFDLRYEFVDQHHVFFVKFK